MILDLFAGIAVSDYSTALEWYTRLFGKPPTFFATATEAVWEMGEHRWIYIEELPERAGKAMQTVFVDDLDTFVAAIAVRGIQPRTTDTYSDGVRKVIFTDPDGNEVGFGGAPAKSN